MTCPCLTNGVMACPLPAPPRSKWPDNDARLARSQGCPAVAASKKKDEARKATVRAVIETGFAVVEVKP
jgi:hypothetical protein